MVGSHPCWGHGCGEVTIVLGARLWWVGSQSIIEEIGDGVDRFAACDVVWLFFFSFLSYKNFIQYCFLDQ